MRLSGALTRGWPPYRVRPAVALDPIQRDPRPHGNVTVLGPNDGARETQALLLIELHRGHRMRRRVIDAIRRGALVQEDQEVNGARTLHRCRYEVVRPA